MRYPASEKLEIIRLVEQSPLPVRRTLATLGILPGTFYRWYDRLQSGGPEALEDRSRECQFSCVRAFHGRLSSTECSRQTLGKEDGELRVGGAPFDSWFPMNAEIPQRQIEQFGGGFV